MDEQFLNDDTLLNDPTFIKAKDRALYILGYKSYTEREMRNKLREQQYSAEIIDAVIAVLKHYAFIDDNAYAQKFAEDRKTAKHFGNRRIQYELIQKGVSAQIVDEVLNNLSEEHDELDDAVYLLRKKYPAIDSEKEKARAVGYLQRRGFSWNIIKETFRMADDE